ncbi:hypothetical protein Ancab_030788 [Ancistrocladus abbreviatus]
MNQNTSYNLAIPKPESGNLKGKPGTSQKSKKWKHGNAEDKQKVKRQKEEKLKTKAKKEGEVQAGNESANVETSKDGDGEKSADTAEFYAWDEL